MGKKLSEDEIKYILSVESSKAQQELYKFTKETKELNKTNKERRSLMRELESLGKKESDEYKRLDNEVKKVMRLFRKTINSLKNWRKNLILQDLRWSSFEKKPRIFVRSLIRQSSPPTRKNMQNLNQNWLK